MAIIAMVLLAAVIVPAGLGGAAGGQTVAVKDDFFAPATLNIRKGGMVTWRWDGGSRHDVVGKGWGSSMKKRGTYSRKFGRAGTFRYFCTLHERMTGKVVVDG